MNYRNSVYSTASSGKRSPTTPPLQFYKQARTEHIPTPPPTSMHFPMNNSSY
jgi:hypothetical protein